ncbi:MAG: nicotinamide-nucleotide amidohydrolase family protein [Clostridia bacterium]|nr:nicotinamide-nucleotide amidohydrolase family protein [Clostridia bacterium]
MLPEEKLVYDLTAAGLTFACAESCTGGLVAARTVNIAGASAVFLGGAVTYANSAKIAMTGVKESTLAAHGAVSEQTAKEMAQGILEKTGADIAVSTTGIAGPDGATPTKPVGTVYIGYATKKKVGARLCLFADKSRDEVRSLAASEALLTALALADEIKG